jgi:hypothetical protein
VAKSVLVELEKVPDSYVLTPSSCVVALKSHFMYSVLDLLRLKPFASKVRLHNFNF